MSGLIYSRWRPDDGGYDYFITSDSPNINDDLPAPVLPQATKIGVPSIEAGRLIPAGARSSGHGDLAVGVVAPVDPSRIVRRVRSLAGIEILGKPAMPWILGGTAVFAIAWYVIRKESR